ncbi:hypothetical protein HS088_TW06G00441 [Tripterygium wilfordii]|uniref:Uncharacterized protein n=1 Tax=Tripterygium wilfordii TaxID=458696 RepID=A0A7J7DIU7_TRIWF|nr:hypothetical protein HS088_TW06G00441 [Tripterygium wilfordii]
MSFSQLPQCCFSALMEHPFWKEKEMSYLFSCLFISFSLPLQDDGSNLIFVSKRKLLDSLCLGLYNMMIELIPMIICSSHDGQHWNRVGYIMRRDHSSISK